MKERAVKDRKRAKSKSSSTETGRVAGQLGGLYAEDPAKPPGKTSPAKKDKTPARPRERG
jgi:hypothetical protein